MKKIAALFIATLTLQSAVAGSAQTHISCKELDDKISLSGDIGDSNNFDLSLKQEDNVSRIYAVTMCNPNGCSTEENGRVTVVENLPKGVYTLKADRDGESISDVELYALPKTVRVKSRPHGMKYQFGGVLNVYDQALGKKRQRYNVLCTTEYAI